MNGLHEDAQEFRQPVVLDGPGRLRSIAGVGPLYEIIGRNDLTVRIRFVDTDKEHDYPLADAELDPIARSAPPREGRDPGYIQSLRS